MNRSRRGDRSARRAGRACLAALCVAALAVRPVAAQTDPEEMPEAPEGLEAAGFVGWISSLANLSDDPESFSTALDPYLAIGAEAVYWLSPRFGVGVTGLFAPSELGTRATQPDLPAPEDLGGVDYLAVVGNLVYRIPVSGTARSVRPYFAVGAGLRHLGLADAARPTLDSATDPAATVAAGVHLQLLEGLQLRMELRDLVSSYEAAGTGESTLQNDIAVTVGVGTRLR